MTTDDERIAYLMDAGEGRLAPRERRDLDELRALLATPAVWVEPSLELESSVVATIRREMPAGAPARWRARSPAPPLAWRRPRGRLAAIAALAPLAATVLAVAIVLGYHGARPAPQRFAMVISGTNLFPGAHGSAVLTKTTSGWEIALEVAGLPRLDGSRFYEAWLKNAAGVLVPVGTFNQPRGITAWSGVPVTAFPTLTVTEQQADGNPASSGVRVLVGTLRL